MALAAVFAVAHAQNKAMRKEEFDRDMKQSATAPDRAGTSSLGKAQSVEEQVRRELGPPPVSKEACRDMREKSELMVKYSLPTGEMGETGLRWLKAESAKVQQACDEGRLKAAHDLAVATVTKWGTELARLSGEASDSTAVAKRHDAGDDLAPEDGVEPPSSVCLAWLTGRKRCLRTVTQPTDKDGCLRMAEGVSGFSMANREILDTSKLSARVEAACNAWDFTLAYRLTARIVDDVDRAVATPPNVLLSIPTTTDECLKLASEVQTEIAVVAAEAWRELYPHVRTIENKCQSGDFASAYRLGSELMQNMSDAAHARRSGK
jgi:hypothetical protein